MPEENGPYESSENADTPQTPGPATGAAASIVAVGPRAPVAANKWPRRLLKVVIFFAVLGCLVLGLAVFFLTKTFNEISGAISNPSGSAASTNQK
jgi:hypothetical protein